MTEYQINFDTLKFNLYDILNISPDASTSKIKKAYRNLILNFHPDKNSSTEEDIYYHIITANQILTNDDYRKKYDNFLNKTNESHIELKNNFNKKIDNAPIMTKEETNKFFNKRMEELNKKHNFNLNDYNSENINKNYEKKLHDRNNEILIPKENISSNNDFNSKFEAKKNNNSFNDQIISIQESKNIILNDNYTSLDVAFDNLYVEDSITTSNYTSLDTAFKILEIESISQNTDIKDAMNKYKAQTDSYKEGSNKYSSTLFNQW